MTFERKTLKAEVRLEGLGLHSGEPVKLIIHPEGDGIWFRWGSERIKAIPTNVTDTSRCTRLGSISTIEHLMSAFAGLEITAAEVELDSPELPAMGGSSLEYVEAIRNAGTESLGSRTIEGPFARVFHVDGDKEIAISKGEGHWRYSFFGGHRWPPEQMFELFIDPNAYASEIAPARTIGFEDELPAIRAAGLAKGLDERSAIVLGAEGYVNEPKFPDEPARHKLLDLIGDLYLSGVPIRHLNVVALRSGHQAHIEAAAKLSLAVRFSD